MNPLQLFFTARTVLNPTKWAQRQINVNQLLLVITFAASFLKGSKYEIPPDLLATVATAAFGIVNWLFTVAIQPVNILGRASASAVVRSTGDGNAGGDAQPTSNVGGGPTISPSPDPVRTGPQATGPTGDFMP